jgi:hypothetical protein
LGHDHLVDAVEFEWAVLVVDSQLGGLGRWEWLSGWLFNGEVFGFGDGELGLVAPFIDFKVALEVVLNFCFVGLNTSFFSFKVIKGEIRDV